MIAAILIGLIGIGAGALLLSIGWALMNVGRHMNSSAAGT